MECSEARRILWPPERLRVCERDVSAAQVHVRDCECCRTYFLQDRALLDLYSRASEIRAPLSVRQRVFDALAAARWGAGSREGGTRTDGRSGDGQGPGEPRAERAGVAEPKGAWLRLLRQGAWPGLMVAALAAVFVGEMRDRPAEDQPSAVFVEDYLRRAVGQEHIVSDDPLEVQRFLERELGLRMDPLSFAGFALRRAEICLLEGRRGAMIVYESDHGAVSHYAVPRDDTPARPPAISTSPATGSMPIVTWSSPGIEQALVGEVEPDLLLKMASGSGR